LVRAGEPVVLFAEHKSTLNRLKKCLRNQHIPFVFIDGSSSRTDRDAAVEAFQKNLVPVFIGSKAAKEGLTLTASRNFIFVERFWTSAEEEQAEDRIRRIGQTHPTKIWFLHVIDTVDDRLATIIEQKRRIVREAIGAAEIDETPEDAVAAIIAGWSKHAGAPQVPGNKVIELGNIAPLPPLPISKDVLSIRFKGDRWAPNTALSWCKMMGYRPRNSTPTKDGFEFGVTNATLFTGGSFNLFRVAQDISMVVGQRKQKR
jgi:arsenate reductase-like glutaredoxin family protein